MLYITEVESPMLKNILCICIYNCIYVYIVYNLYIMIYIYIVYIYTIYTYYILFIYIYIQKSKICFFCGQPLTRASQVGPGTAAERSHSAAVQSPRKRRHEHAGICILHQG